MIDLWRKEFTLREKILNETDERIFGEDSDTIGNLRYLTLLDLSNNQFIASIPNSISKLSILRTFLADSNNFSGTLPNDICNIYDQDSNFKLSGNQFCNDFPSCLDSPEILGYQHCDTSCKPEYEFKSEIITGISAPPIGITSNIPRSADNPKII